MSVSVILTVKNEGEAMRPLLDSLIQQTEQPSEIVVCDGGSNDSTLDILESYRRWLPLKVISAPGTNISEGRNRAIEAAQGPYIAATDAGVALSPYWLEELIRPLRKDDAMVVSGWFESDPFTDFEVVMGATVLPQLEDVDPFTFLPSSRSVAFHKDAWRAVGGYPEWLDFGEDLVYDMALYRRYGPFPMASRAIAYFRPRSSMRAFFRQYYLYARGDGKADLWLKRHLIRYATYLVGLPILLRFIWREKLIGWLGLLGGMAIYCLRPAQRLWGATRGWRLPARVRALALIPVIRVVGDMAKMAGYPAGLLWRRRNNPPR